MSAKGPIIFEVEGDGSGAQVVQHARGRGLRDAEFLAFLEAWKAEKQARFVRKTGGKRGLAKLKKD